QQRMRERLSRIDEVARRENSKLLLLMIPAPVQVCSAAQLKYYPRHVDLHDTQRFEIDRPQRLLSTMAAQLHIPTQDLRSTLNQATACPYQPSNLHWTAAGHEMVAATVAHVLLDQGFVDRSAPGSSNG
ncbi:MAG TPA: hypothetical protein VMT89_01870, partial [Candidatus Acidoferrales bacterium]|nr:hypothetical protein [Candidatus Acidoferrales bacterium]